MDAELTYEDEELLIDSSHSSYLYLRTPIKCRITLENRGKWQSATHIRGFVSHQRSSHSCEKQTFKRLEGDTLSFPEMHQLITVKTASRSRSTEPINLLHLADTLGNRCFAMKSSDH